MKSILWLCLVNRVHYLTFFNAIWEIFDKNNIQWENLIGIGQKPNVMRGVNNSVVQKLKERVPNLIKIIWLIRTFL